MKKTIARSRIVRAVLVLGLAFSAGLLGAELAYADDPTPCGVEADCNWVPGGCAQGDNCVRKTCKSASCPNPDMSNSECHYCQTNG